MGRTSRTGLSGAGQLPRRSGLFGGLSLARAVSRPKRLIGGGGNCSGQIQAEVSEVAQTIWVTPKEPNFLPDEVDGRVLFERATAHVKGKGSDTALGGLGVMLPPVREACDLGVLKAVRPFERFIMDGVVWQDGTQICVDAVNRVHRFQAGARPSSSVGRHRNYGRVRVEDSRA